MHSLESCSDTKLGLTPCEIMNCITLSACFCDSTKVLISA
jgi:hypothetical protein